MTNSFLKIICNGAIVISKDAVDKNDLIEARDDDSTVLINISEMTYFRPEKNEWMPIKSAAESISK